MPPHSFTLYPPPMSLRAMRTDYRGVVGWYTQPLSFAPHQLTEFKSESSFERLSNLSSDRQTLFNNVSLTIFVPLHSFYLYLTRLLPIE